jgi:very-short-patch-repair endonuclease
MAVKNRRAPSRGPWRLAREQHGVVSRGQLLAGGLSASAIQRRVESGRLHPLVRGTYAVGRPSVTRHGRWMAAVLACDQVPTAGRSAMAALSHASAAALWGLAPDTGDHFEVSVRTAGGRRRPGLKIHRRPSLSPNLLTRHAGIPVTRPVQTLVDIATFLGRDRLERALSEADRLDLADPERIREELAAHRGEPGVAELRGLLDRGAFRLTDSELERRFLAVARSSGLAVPLTRQWLNGFRVDFLWPELCLVVETDGLRYHRTAAQQARDRRRDQAHARAGFTTLRFTHAQVRFETEAVQDTLIAVSARLEGEHERRLSG